MVGNISCITVFPIPQVLVSVAEDTASLPIFITSGVDLPLKCVRHDFAGLIRYCAGELREERV